MIFFDYKNYDLNKNYNDQIAQEDHIKNWINKNIDNIQINPEDTKYLSNWFVILEFLFFISIILLPLGFLIKNKRKTLFDNAQNILEPLHQECLKYYLKTKYKDIELVSKTKFENIDKRAILKYRGKDIPRDADIRKITLGYKMKSKNNTSIYCICILWHWERYNGKNTQHYYKSKCYWFVESLDNIMKNLNFEIKRDTIFTKKKHELENQEFNKTFVYEYSDPIKFRMIFTPYTQEIFLKAFEKDKSIMVNTFNKNGKNVLLISSSQNQKIYSIFHPTFHVNCLKNKEKFKKIIKRDFTNDFSTIILWVKKISCLKKLM